MRFRILLNTIILLFYFLCGWSTYEARANEIHVAVASNFYNPFRAISKKFEEKTLHKVKIISGSTGKLYAQILNGAPFEIFLSADNVRTELLEQKGATISGSRYSYALGKITLWSPNINFISNNIKSTLLLGHFSHIAIANPVTAPYGKATVQILKKLDLWKKLKSIAVQGENINQTFQFVFSNNAQLGFVALSQVLDPKIIHKGKRIDIPGNYYDPIKQDLVILKKGAHNNGVKDLWEFLKGDIAKQIIKNYGYGLP